MNYSKPMRKRDISKRLALFLTLWFLAGCLTGAIIAILISTFANGPDTPAPDSEQGEKVEDVGPSHCSTYIPEMEVPSTPTPTAPEPVSLGTFRVTAYCPCEICCGAWAENRPDGIVYGAYGKVLQAGISCASPLPYGTVLEVDGVGEYIVQDKIAQWVIEKYGENQIDIYFDDHEAACEFGLQYLNVYLKEDES